MVLDGKRTESRNLAFWTENGIHNFGRNLDGKRENGQLIAEEIVKFFSHSLALL